MVIRIALFAVPTVVFAGLVLLLNALDASVGVAALSICFVAVLSGAALGVFADRLPELPRAWRRHGGHPGGIAGVRHARH
jgi:amino acid transporter